MSNPFEGTQNAWANDGGPRYGNAYEDTPINMPSPTHHQQNSPYITQKMPSPSDYNAWQESNKTLEEPSASPTQNAYQYSGTPYGNTNTTSNAYSPQVAHQTVNQPHKIEAPMTVAEEEQAPVVVKRDIPSKIRWVLRIVLLVAAIGHLGFAAGASPRSGRDVPFGNKSCFYYLFAVAILSIIYSAYHTIFYFFRRFGRVKQMRRLILIILDLVMALLWGIGVIIEVAKYSCKPGTLDGWCDFYNTSIFFGFLSFAIYIVLVGFDVFGSLCGGRKD